MRTSRPGSAVPADPGVESGRRAPRPCGHCAEAGKHQNPWGQSSRHRRLNVQTSTSDARSPFRRKTVSPFDPTDLGASRLGTGSDRSRRVARPQPPRRQRMPRRQERDHHLPEARAQGATALPRHRGYAGGEALSVQQHRGLRVLRLMRRSAAPKRSEWLGLGRCRSALAYGMIRPIGGSRHPSIAMGTR